MNDYISRQAAIAAIHELKMSVSGYDNDALDVSLIYEVLGEIPAADVKPVKRGKWIDVTETVVSGKTKDGRELEINIVSGKCSCCQHYAEQVNILPTIMKYSICPNCGALMQDE